MKRFKHDLAWVLIWVLIFQMLFPSSASPVHADALPAADAALEPSSLGLSDLRIVRVHEIEPATAAAPREPFPALALYGPLQSKVAPPTLPPLSVLPSARPPILPQAAPMYEPIPFSLLAVSVFGPPVASLGSPVGAGEWYTIVVRNDSISTAYNFYLTATHESYFIYDSGGALTHSVSNTLATDIIFTSDTITWTPTAPANLAPGEVLTLTFRLRAACNAQSGQRLEASIWYNANPAQPPVERNFSGLNITTGRGNMVITKSPPIQDLGTPDFGQPITWTITVQNTGLGKLYNATITDAGGINLGAPTLTPPTTTIPVLDVNETFVYTAVGTVEACNLTNDVFGSWQCGNQAGDATASNPLSSTVSILYNPEIPNVQAQVSSPILFEYCAAVTRTVTITLDNPGGPAGLFRLDSTLESDAFLEMVPGSLSGDWTYSGGLFSYTGGSPAGAIPGSMGGLTLTFQVRPKLDFVCSAGSGQIVFTPLYQDVCGGNPFTGTPALLNYLYAYDVGPELAVEKDGPGLVNVGQTFSYTVTVSGQHLNGQPVYITDTLPGEFEFVGPLTPSAGSAISTASGIAWQFTPTATPFSETLVYWVRAITTTGGVCGASQIVDNGVAASAQPPCPGCPPLQRNDQVSTAIQNNEGVSSNRTSAGAFEVCDAQGFVITNTYQVTGTTTITWTGAVFTEALGTGIGDGALPGAGLAYIPGSLSVVIDGVEYVTLPLTPVTTTGQLMIDLSPLQGLAPTQTLAMTITYRVSIPESALNGEVEQTFYDWTQLYLPGVSDEEACAGNNSFNQALVLTISRGDLSISLAPAILDRCGPNRAIITVQDNQPNRVTDHVVVTFTASSAEIASARGFIYTGGLLALGAPTVISNTNIGGGRGVITFTFPAGADLNGNGEIHFDVDIGCTGESPWAAGVTFESLCGFAHGDDTALPHVYRAPNLLLFATPIRYTVRDKEVRWKFFIANNGNLTAANVLITNTISGLAVFSYTVNDDSGVSLLTTLPVTGTPGAAVIGWNIDELAPNEQRAFTVTAQVVACTPLGVDIDARLDCLGETCQLASAQVDFNTPDPYLLTNNGQSADLPMCDLGQVMFTTKNASADVTLYHLDITETMRSLFPAPGEPITMVIEAPDGTPLVTTTAFVPITQTVGDEYRLIWRAVDAPAEVYSWFNALPPLHVVRIWVPVNTTCLPNTSPQSWASAAALAPCDRHLSYDEDAVTFNTLQPDMTLLKRSSTDGVNWAERAYATPGEAVYWRLDVQNRFSARSYVAQNVVLTDTWPANFVISDTTPGYTVDLASRTITWTLGDVPPGAAALTFYITGTITEEVDACAESNLNRASLRYGCDDGCTSTNVPFDTADVWTVPDLEVIIDPSPVSLCGDEIPILIRNNGSRAYSTTLTVTLPSGHYVYSYTVSSGLMPSQVYSTPLESPRFVWDEIPGRTMSGPYEFVLTLRVDNYAGSGVCPNAYGMPVSATLYFDKHPVCAAPGPWTTTDNVSLNVLAPDLRISKLPRTQTRDVGETITWTLIVTNVGTDIAENVIITDVAGSNFTVLGATPGAPGGDVPVVNGNVVTWTLASPIPAYGGVWTAQVSALMLETGDNRNVVTATAACAVGCQSSIITDTSYTTLLQEFRKNPDVQTGTVGSLLVFIFTSTLPDVDGLYQDLTITDTLPAGLGYVASVLTYVYDQDVGGGTTVVLNTPTIFPALYGSGPVVWQLGDQPGIVQISGVITAVIQNAAAAFDGARLVNDLRMTYTDDGQPYVYTDTADVDVLEPILHIGKTYVTPYGCGATLLESNFNDGSASGWAPSSGTWNVVQGEYRATGSGATRLNGSTAWTDYSFSAMLRGDSTTNRPGLYVRYANSNNYLRLFWSSTSNLRLEQRVGGTTNTVQNYSLTFTPNVWYHFEVQVVSNTIYIWVNGALLTPVRTFNAALSAGRVGLYNSGTGTAVSRFDDILVTRLDNMACTVGANDLVTYTLTISNQSHLPGHDLVITDVIPAGTSFVSSALVSNDPAAAVVYTPSVGATGVLTWGVNQLAATAPFNPLAHTYFTLTVVLQVDDGIPANTVLSNQAFLAYDAWPDDSQPTPIVREYSGGSHSTAVRTIDGGIAKFGLFDPPPTATLGTLITYTLVVPVQPISATLYGVQITDTVDGRLSIESVVAAGGTGGASGWAGQVVTASFASIPHGTQATITVTARISDPLGAVDGDVLSNIGDMSHDASPGITQTNEITTPVYEPLVSVSKVGAITDDPQQAVYTLTVVNDGNSAAYSMRVTDTLPAGLTPIDISNGGVWSPAERTIAWTIPALDVPPPPANTLVLTYSVRLDQAIYQGSQFVNAVLVHNTSLTETIPGVRPYITDTTYPLEWPLGRLGDYVWYDFDNDGVQGTHPGEFPIGGVIIDLYDSTTGEYITSTVTDGSGWYIFEYLPLNVTYTVIISTASYGPGGPLEGYTQTLWTVGAPDTDSNASITQTFGTLPYAITTTLTTVFTEDLTLDYGFVQLVEIGNYVWFDVNNDGLQNDGPINGLGGVTITITYPDGRVFTTTTTADGYYTFTVPISQVYTITVIADNFLPGGPLEGYTNTLIDASADDEIDSDGVPVSGGLTIVTPVITEDDYSFDFGLIIDVEPSITKALAFSPPPTPTLGTVVTFSLLVPNPSITRTLDAVIITDVLDVRLYPLAVDTSGGLTPTWTINGQVVTVQFARIEALTQAHITITAVISDGQGAQAGDTITNAADLDYSGASGITSTNEVSLTVGEPQLVLVKASEPPTSSTVGAGSAITYAVIITNVGDPNGPAPAYDLVLSDTLPAGANDIAPLLLAVLLDGAPVDAGLYTTNYAGGVWTLAFTPAFSMPVGSVLTIQYRATVDADVPVGVDLTNTAQVIWSSLPGDTPGDRDYGPLQDSTTVHTALPGIVKTVEPPTATIGQVITYTIRVPDPLVSATLENVVVSDALSPWLEILDVNAPGSAALDWEAYPAVLTATYTVIPAGEQRWITVTAAVISDTATPPWQPVAGDQITNTATLSHSTGITSSNEVTVTVVEPQLVIDKISDPPPGSTVVAGQAVTYTVVVTNIGDSPAYRYTFEDELPVGMRGIAPVLIGVTIDGLPVDPGDYVSGYSGASGIFYVEFENWAPLPPGSVLEIVYVAYVDVDVAAGVDLTNIASIGWMSWLPDTMPGPRVYPPVTDTNTVNTGYAVFDLIKEAAPSPVAAGMLLTYTLRVTNTGVARANDVLITDTVPVGTAFVEATPPYSGPDAADVLTWTLGALDVGETRVLTLVVRVNSDLIGGEVSNTAWISSSEDITGTDTVTTPISLLADVTVVKRDDPDPAWPGGTLVYTLVYTNNGPSDAQNVLVTDTLPVEVTFVAADPAPAGGPNPLVWNLGALPAGASGQIVITTTVNSDVTEPFTNLVTIGADTPESDTDNNDDDESTGVLVPGLEVVKTVSVGEAVRNMPFTYTIRITNTGQLTIDPLMLVDTLPADFYYTPGTGSPSEPDVWAEPTLIWYDLGALAPGESITVSFGVTATPGITGTYVNVVTATGVVPGGTVTDTDDTSILINDPAVEVEKRIVAVDTDLVAPNYITFTITITNVGVSVIDVLPLVDQYDPYYLGFTDATPYPEQDADDGMVTWNDLTGPAPHGFGRNLPPGASFVITTVFRVVNNIITTTNAATVTDAIDLYDNPANDDDDEVEIGGEEGGVPTPITLLYLRATAEDGAVRVRWATIAELGTVGFDLYRAGSERWEEAGWITYVPATGPGSTYDYLDARVVSGQWYWYWLVERVPGDTELPQPEAIHGPVSVDMRLNWLPYRIYLPLISNNSADRR